MEFKRDSKRLPLAALAVENVIAWEIIKPKIIITIKLTKKLKSERKIDEATAVRDPVVSFAVWERKVEFGKELTPEQLKYENNKA